MLQRRNFLSGLATASFGGATLGLAFSALGQRPAHPIALPPGQRAGRALIAGRFHDGGVASGALPGVYVVVAVDTQADTLQLRDESGRTGAVRVAADRYDIAQLKPGDEVEVDFLVPQPGSTALEAGALWKVQR